MPLIANILVRKQGLRATDLRTLIFILSLQRILYSDGGHTTSNPENLVAACRLSKQWRPVKFLPKQSLVK